MAEMARRILGDLRSMLLGRYFRRSYSQEGEDMILRRIFDRCTDGFFVDVGAHHPMRFSNTCSFYLSGWRGINIEPNPEAMPAFRALRRRDTNLCVGVADAPGQLTYFRFDDAALNTFDAHLAQSRRAAAPHRWRGTACIEVQRLDAILDRHLPRGRRIDLLSIDTEGFDMSVLRSNDWTRFRPACVLVEAFGVDIERVADSAIGRFMQELGYRLVAKTFNSLIFVDGRDPGMRDRFGVRQTGN